MAKIKTPNEYRLIYLCTRLKINDPIQQEIRKLMAGPFNWGKTIKISLGQEVLPFLYYNLNRLNLQEFIPKNTFRVMENYYYANLKKNLLLEKELSLIGQLTKDKSAGIIPFKGFALIQTLYPDPGLRMMTDVDILVKESEYQTIAGILAQLGYQQDLAKGKCEQHPEHRSEVAFSKRVSSNLLFIIELHCSIVPARPYKINLPRLWERAQEAAAGNQALLYPSQEDTFMSLALHLRRHTRRLTLKFIIDIAELLNFGQKKFDWSYIKGSARDNRIITTIYLALYLAKELLETDIPFEINRKFRPNPAKIALIRLVINKDNFFTLNKLRGGVLRLLLFDKPIDIVFYLWKVYFLEIFLGKLRFKNKQRYNNAKKGKKISE
jgi:hypothetical protein